jgi:hypothetical protein
MSPLQCLQPKLAPSVERNRSAIETKSPTFLALMTTDDTQAPEDHQIIMKKQQNEQI